MVFRHLVFCASSRRASSRLSIGRRSLVAIFALLVLGTEALLGQSIGPAFAPAAERAAVRQEPTKLADTLGLEAAVVLSPASEGARDEVAALEAWNRAGKLPLRNGFTRALPETLSMELTPASLRVGGATGLGSAARREPNGSLIWTIRIRAEHAYRVRLHLHDLRVPDGTLFWVYSEDGETSAPFGKELMGPDGDLWTPSVAGGRVTLEARVPMPAPDAPDASAAMPSLILREVIEIVELDERGLQKTQSSAPEANESCLIDGRCVGSTTLDIIDRYRSAVAHLQYVEGGESFICSGGLLTTTDSSFDALLLTANHCFDSQGSATTLEAFWDFTSAVCGGPWPPLGSLPKSNGATLLATGGASDFTLVRLSSIPGGRTFLGWNAQNDAAPNNTLLHRLSHPQGYAQAYSRARVVQSPAGTCTGVPISHYIYSTREAGATFGGSSGAPVILAGGYVVGQLLGRCGTNISEPCLFGSTDNYFIDGRLSQTYPFIAQFLDPEDDPSPPGTGQISSSQYPDFRFWVRISNERVGTPVGGCLPETVCIAGAIPTRAEVFLRIVGPKSNGYLWPNVVKFNTTKTEVWIRQISTGVTKYYLLAALPTDSSTLPGLVDKTGFLP